MAIRRAPSEAGTPQPAAPFLVSGPLSPLSVLSGNGQLLPNLEGEFDRRSVLPGADRQSLEKQRTKPDVLIIASHPRELAWQPGKWTRYQLQQRGTAQ